MRNTHKIAEASATGPAVKLALDTKNNNYNTSKASCAADVQRLIRDTIKHTKPAYNEGKRRRQADEHGWRLNRVLKAVRRRYSVDAYKELVMAVNALSELERRLWVKQMERKHGYR